MSTSDRNLISLFLCGDVMTGRGIDQALPHPGDPTLYESYMRDARDYVSLAEEAHGAIPRPASFNYIWGDALRELQVGVDVRIINLETSITQSNDYWAQKGIHYRMHPQNVGCITKAKIDACCLANNHTLDWGYSGLAETVHVLNDAGITCVGAGRNNDEAEAPAILDVPGKGRVLLFSVGSITSGIPTEWSATHERSGLNVLEELSQETAMRLASRMQQNKRPGDVTIASIHWGNNWGYEIPVEQIVFARRLVDQGFDIVHGHSSHHVKTIEIYRGRLILYGCGDFITDYEGITGYEAFRGDLALMYLVKVDPVNGELAALRLVPLQLRQFQLKYAADADVKWLHSLLSQLGATSGTQFELSSDNSMNWKAS